MKLVVMYVYCCCFREVDMVVEDLTHHSRNKLIQTELTDMLFPEHLAV